MVLIVRLKYCVDFHTIFANFHLALTCFSRLNLRLDLNVLLRCALINGFKNFEFLMGLGCLAYVVVAFVWLRDISCTLYIFVHHRNR